MGYTKLNLREDVEDQAPNFELSPQLEFRSARAPLETQNAALSYLRVAPGYRLPFAHHHAEQEEIYVLVEGSARIRLDDEVVELRPFDAVRIDRETMRNLEGGPEGAVVILFGAPNTGSGDAQLTQGWWVD
jgi:mannose-6-phosphate isomerase-like protein (cupin superfamily)